MRSADGCPCCGGFTRSDPAGSCPGRTSSTCSSPTGRAGNAGALWEAPCLTGSCPSRPQHVPIALSCEISLPPGVSLSSQGILGWQTCPSRFPMHHNSRAISRFMNVARCPRVQVLNATSVWSDGYCKTNWTVRTAPPIVQPRMV